MTNLHHLRNTNRKLDIEGRRELAEVLTAYGRPYGTVT